MNKKVLILIVSSDTYPSRRNKSMQEKTWILNQQDNQQIYFYESGEATGFGDNNTIYVESGKSTLDMSTKTDIESYVMAMYSPDKSMSEDLRGIIETYNC